MRRPLLLVAAIAALLSFPAIAAAKGPSTASISGPGLRQAINIEGYGEGGNDTALGILVSEGGFFAQAFGATPAASTTRPAGTLGARYEVTYTVPGGSNGDSTLRQDLYPYAVGGPATYMPPAQRFWGTQSTPGGWYRGSVLLRQTLVKAGLPILAPTARHRQGKIGAGLPTLPPTARHRQSKIGVGVAAGAGVGLVAGALILLRRRQGRATTQV
jgi:hypothetical protein